MTNLLQSSCIMLNKILSSEFYTDKYLIQNNTKCKHLKIGKYIENSK